MDLYSLKDASWRVLHACSLLLGVDLMLDGWKDDDTNYIIVRFRSDRLMIL